MKNFLLLSLISLMVFIAGCVRSLYPLFTEKDYMFDQRIVGSWPDKSGNAWIFSKGEDKSYVLKYYQHEFGRGIFKEGVPGDTGVFEAHLGRLGNNLFLDVYPQRDPSLGSPDRPYSLLKNDFYNWHFVPMHSIMKVWFVNDSLQLSLLDNNWVRKMIDNKSIKISHERLDDQIILTASTEELQQLVLKYADDNKAFPKEERD